MKKIYSLGIALVVLFALTMSATALSSKIMQRTNGESVDATWQNSNGGYSYVWASKSNQGTDVNIVLCTSGDYESCKYGYLFTQKDILNVDKKLNSAILTLETIIVYDNYGNPETINNIQVQWQGVGETQDGSYKYISKYNDIIFKASSSSLYRTAIATGSAYGYDLGENIYGDLVKFKSATMEMQK
jgi:hypothetical protein